ncbi:MAG TPA: ECF-type sigma factor [Steroidobacteraceae bacterium]|jgi:RNA polymerase sigma factor (TIGR02999 family)|nr:ECF-type sigma factor [Steroidobacteraceae bacterium]
MGIEPPVIAEQRSDATDVAKNRQLFASLYGDLRRLAEYQLRRSQGALVSPTTLLHEAYIGMADREVHFPDRDRFMGYAARVMRGLIIDLVRERCALKRGGAYHITQLPTEVEESAESAADLALLSDALDELAVREPRLAGVVDLKYFCGFTFEDIAAQRGTSLRTVLRDWEKARLILFKGLHES